MNPIPSPDPTPAPTPESSAPTQNGWAFLGLNILIYLAALLLIFLGVRTPPILVAGVFTLFGAIFVSAGFFTLQPNEAAVLILFGAYKGSVKSPGFHWLNPFMTKQKISLRARNLNSERLKVNDKRGNPIEIAAVVVWRVNDTAQASFDVESFEQYVQIQTESAVRHLARCYAYDEDETDALVLRSGDDAILRTLHDELQDRTRKAGVQILETRLTHLAYAPEIAQAMLRRQAAEAIIIARKKIVHGAVSMVQMALEDLEKQGVVELDQERKASMVSNLLVVLCGEAEVQPVVNTGTLYT